MNLEVQRLHWAALRYCMENHNKWALHYTRGAWTEAEGEGIFPRYQVLEAIRLDLERMTGGLPDDLSEARALFVDKGLTAETEFTRLKSVRARLAMNDERYKFIVYVRSVSVAELDEVEPLPFNRVLTPTEADAIWASIERRWGLKRRSHWIPLSEPSRPDVAAFQNKYFDLKFPPEILRSLLSGRGISRVWELCEYGPEREIDVALFEPGYFGPEGMWTSSSLDWIVYASHEASITVGGWLLDAVRAAWPESDRHVWTTPFFD